MNTNTAAFAATQPQAWAWISENMQAQPFAASMFAAVVRYGRLTQNQLNAVLRWASEPPGARVTIDLTQLDAGFRAAALAAHQTEATIGGFKISFAKSSSRNAGCLYVKEGRTYLGKIDTDGQFHPVSDCTDEHRTRLVAINQGGGN